MKYFDALKEAMTWLGQQPNTFFLGQAVTYPGTAMTNTLTDVPAEKKLEMPVAEDMQMGMSIGMALNGTIPVTIFPRWNFMLLATNQIVNHLDKIPLMADKPFQPKVIIRVGVGSERPLHPQHQHVGDYAYAFELMCPNIEVLHIRNPEDALPCYQTAYNRQDGKSTILVEFGDFYQEK